MVRRRGRGRQEGRRDAGGDYKKQDWLEAGSRREEVCGRNKQTAKDDVR